MSNARYYKVVPASDAQEEMSHPDCVTTSPRYSVDRSSVVLKFKSEVDGSMSHADAITLMATDAWSEPMEIPQ